MLYRLVEEWGEANGKTMPFDELAKFLLLDRDYFAQWAKIEVEDGGNYCASVADYIESLVRYGFVEKVEN